MPLFAKLATALDEILDGAAELAVPADRSGNVSTATAGAPADRARNTETPKTPCTGVPTFGSSIADGTLHRSRSVSSLCGNDDQSTGAVRKGGKLRRNSASVAVNGHSDMCIHSLPTHESSLVVTPEEKAIFAKLGTQTNTDALLAELAARPIHGLSLGACNDAFKLALEKRVPYAPVDALYQLYNRMCSQGPTPNKNTYAMVVHALCLSDMELGSRFCTTALLPEGDNLARAVHVAQTAHATKHLIGSVDVYNELLKCCSMRGRSREALLVVSLIEDNVWTTKNADSYRLLLLSIVNDRLLVEGESPAQHSSRLLSACSLVFSTFERVAAAMTAIDANSSAFSPSQCAEVWATMLDVHFLLGDAVGAVALFERMLASQSCDAVPLVDEGIISRMVLGFVLVDDCLSAVQWLWQLHTSQLPMPSATALEGVLAATLQQQPAEAALMLRDIATILVARDAPETSASAVTSRCVTNLADVLEHCQGPNALSDADLHSCFDALHALAQRVFAVYTPAHPIRTRQQCAPVAALLRLAAQQSVEGRADEAGILFALSMSALRSTDLASSTCVSLLRDGCHLPMAIADAALVSPARDRSLGDACVRFVALATVVAPALSDVQCTVTDAANTAMVRQYECASRELHGRLQSLPVDEAAWHQVLSAFVAVEQRAPSTFPGPDGHSGLGKLLSELAQLPLHATHGCVRPTIDVDALRALLVGKYGEEGALILDGWVHDASRLVPRAPIAQSVSPPLPTPEHTGGVSATHLPAVVSIDNVLSNAIQGLARPHGQVHAEELYERVHEKAKHGVYPSPGALAVLLNACGRNADAERIDELYAMALHVLASRSNNREWRMAHWTQLEDGMITALSHAGLGERANVHRQRLISADQVPSASAYAALIATIQERTDDAVVAEQLFSESQRLGVRPTTYLYNTVISKLSRARKVDQALRLFDEMRTANLRPSSVTYGAAINACVRTGDETRATQLFAEMEAQPTFQPRVPPYNTMIQYFVHSTMDREKALHYYEKMQQAGVRPSAHTYKLLLDLWGTIEPVQSDRQRAVFSKLSADRLVGVQGTHWASLIHTQGTVLHDLEQALETFESIAEHAPATRMSISTVPDAVVYESLFAVFVAHGRTDLMPAYLARMVGQGILPTAYIANLLIKGYAQDGLMGLVEARRVFDAMIDPPAGIAAAGNHLPRHHGAGALGMRRERMPVRPNREQALDRANMLGAHVYREPSTYEAMIRAELSYGHTDRASALFERMKARAFPAALLNRARAMFDHVGARH